MYQTVPSQNMRRDLYTIQPSKPKQQGTPKRKPKKPILGYLLIHQSGSTLGPEPDLSSVRVDDSSSAVVYQEVQEYCGREPGIRSQSLSGIDWFSDS